MIGQTVTQHTLCAEYRAQNGEYYEVKMVISHLAWRCLMHATHVSVSLTATTITEWVCRRRLDHVS